MIEEQIYKIVDTQTGEAIMTGRTNDPERRAREYRLYDWWRPEYKLEPYRIIARHGMNDEDYGMYAAAVEHMEICRNRTWDVQGGRNKMSPLVQRLWGPEAIKEVSRMGGLVGGILGGRIQGRRNAQNGQLASIAIKGAYAAGRIAKVTGQASALGRKAVESGQLAAITTYESRSKGGKTQGVIQGRKNVDSGHIHKLGRIQGRKNAESGRMAEIGKLGGRVSQGGKARTEAKLKACAENLIIANHKHWHIRRGITNANCSLCQQQKAA
jgi:hypothetical protein